MFYLYQMLGIYLLLPDNFIANNKSVNVSLVILNIKDNSALDYHKISLDSQSFLESTVLLFLVNTATCKTDNSIEFGNAHVWLSNWKHGKHITVVEFFLSFTGNGLA